MPGINTGILTNASPLSTARIKELESQVLNGGKSFAYLDENNKLCFALPHGVAAIKDLAWDNAYELTNTEGTLIKKAYKKTGLDTFFLDKTFTKSTVNEIWQALAKVFEFDGDPAGILTVQQSADTYLVKVSDKIFDANELVGSTVTTTGNINNEEVEPATYIITEANIAEEYIEELDLKLVGIFAENAGEAALVISINRDYYDFSPGTYFLMLVFTEDFSERAYTKSISCLTEADIVPALTNRLTPEEIFDLFAWKDRNESDLVVIDYKDAKYLKVSDKAFSTSEVSFQTLNMWYKAYSMDNPAGSTNTLSGIVRPEHITYIVEDAEIDIIEVSLISCSEQLPGYVGGGDSTAVISVANNCIYNGVSFEKGTYFLETSSAGIRSISCLAAVDTYAL